MMSKCKKLSHILDGIRKAMLKAAVCHLFQSPLLLLSHCAVFLNLIMCFQQGVDLFIAQDGWGLVSVITADEQESVESGFQEGKEQ